MKVDNYFKMQVNKHTLGKVKDFIKFFGQSSMFIFEDDLGHQVLLSHYDLRNENCKINYRRMLNYDIELVYIDKYINDINEEHSCIHICVC